MGAEGGVGRQIDKLGRIVIPVEIRNSFGLDSQSSVTFSLDGERIVLAVGERATQEAGCVFCGRYRGLRKFRNHWVCASCAEELSQGRSDEPAVDPHSALKTHCPRSHEYTTSNTYTDTKGNRRCRECKRLERARRQPLSRQEALRAP